MTEVKLFVIFIIIVIIAAFFSFFLSPVFNLRHIELTGFNNVDEKNVREKIDTFLNKNIWLIDVEEVKEAISIDNYVKSVKVEKKYPDKLSIFIKEHTPLGKINNNGKYLVFNKDGYILEEGTFNCQKVPQIRGLGYSFRNELLVFPSVFKKIVQALSIINEKTRKSMNLILYSEQHIICTLDNEIKIKLGRSNNLIKKFQILSTLKREIDKKKNEIEYVDLRIAEKPVIKLK